MRLKKIKVYGKLRQFLGKSYFMAAVKSPQQAMSFLIANFEGIQKHMNDQIYKVKMGGRVITEEYLSMTGQGDIQIIPIATGSGPLIPIIIGAGAIGAGAAVGGATLLATVLSTALTTIGTSMVIGGVTDLLAPQNPIPNVSSVSDIDPAIRGSYSFSGIQNVSSSGVPVPILYGLVYSGSIIISSGVDTAQVVRSIAKEGTYVQSDGAGSAGFFITVTSNNHGFIDFDKLRLDFISGGATDGIYTIFSVTKDTFIVQTNVSALIQGLNDVIILEKTGVENFDPYYGL